MYVWLTRKQTPEYLSLFLYACENAFSENLPSGLQNPYTNAEGYMGSKLYIRNLLED